MGVLAVQNVPKLFRLISIWVLDKKERLNNQVIFQIVQMCRMPPSSCQTVSKLGQNFRLNSDAPLLIGCCSRRNGSLASSKMLALLISTHARYMKLDGLAPCGWRCPHRRLTLMRPFGNW
jgi:hypothetical protein